MRRGILPYFTLTLVVLITTLIVWLPFLLRSPNWYGIKIADSNMQYIYRNYDGPLYIVPAKTLYNPALISKLEVELPLSEKYFAAHLPLYPVLIRTFAPFIGYLKSMLFVNLLATILLTNFFYFFVKKFKLTKNPLLLSIVFLFIPKFLVVRSIGAPESLFILLILLSLYFFEQKNYWLAGLFGGLSATTKTPGILLTAAYSLVFLEEFLKTKKINWRWIGISLIPLGLIAVFLLYWLQYNDFLAYFHSGDNIHLYGLFSVFNFQAKWVAFPWIEEVVFYFFLYGLTTVYLFKSQKRSFFYYSLVFFIAIIFVQHRDIPRYSLPLWPMALVAFERFFTDKKFLLVFLFLLPAIYLFAWDFIIYNVMPISNWSPYL